MSKLKPPICSGLSEQQQAEGQQPKPPEQIDVSQKLISAFDPSDLELFLVSDRSGGLRINRAIDNIAGVIAGLPPVPDLNRINTSADLLTAVFNTYLDQDAPDMNIAEYNLPDKAEQFVYDLRCVALLIEPKNVYSFFDQTKALLEGPLDNDFIFDIYNTQLQNLVQRVKEANSSGRRGENRTCVDQKITKILSYICEKTSEANLLTYQGNPLRGLNYEITAHIEQLVSPPRETDSGPCDYAGADGDRPESGEKKRIVYTSQGLAKKLTGQRDIYRCTDNQVNAVLDDIESQDGKIIGVNLKKISDGRMTRAELFFPTPTGFSKQTVKMGQAKFDAPVAQIMRSAYERVHSKNRLTGVNNATKSTMDNYLQHTSTVLNRMGLL